MGSVCYEMARLQARGMIFPRNYTEGIEELRSTCNAGDSYACAEAAQFMRRADSEHQELSRAADYNRKGCDGEGSLACRQLGSAYLHGVGVEREPERAAELLADTCNEAGDLSCLGYADALAGTALLFGVDRALAPDRAAETFERGCRAGSGLSCKLRLSLDILERVPLTGDAFYTYADKACEAGGAADCYAAGRRVATYKFDRGAGLVRRACRKEEVRACLWLAMRGQSVE
jgi:hypothetical protein